jgi:cytochrome c oxidase subunit I
MENPQNFTVSRPLSAASKRWLLIGVWAVALAGLYSLVLVIARTPALAAIPLFKRLFHEALVVHVDLSVLVWFLAIACLMWSLLIDRAARVMPYVEKAAQWCFVGGIVGLCAAPLDPAGEALMSNYIPVIMSPVFFIGLALIFCGLGLMAVQVLIARPQATPFSPALAFGVWSAAPIALASLAAFYASFRLLPPEIEGQQYYELGFWGGGHILQFTHTQILMVCWLWLAHQLHGSSCLKPALLKALFAVGIVATLASPLAYALYDVTSGEFRQFFTHKMIAIGGIAPALLGLYMLYILKKSWAERKGRERALWSSLLMSVVLFLYGGFLGLLIQGQNVVIPAHYHGSIVGVTLAFMGAAYLLLPHMGAKPVAGTRLAYWQPIVYGVGQIMHISGLAYSGGYGVLRKTPGVVQNVGADVQAALGFMGLGGLLAIIGGVMFVVAIYRSVR